MPSKLTPNTGHNLLHVLLFCLILLAAVLLLANKRAADNASHDNGTTPETPQNQQDQQELAVASNEAPPAETVTAGSKICQTVGGNETVVPLTDDCPEDRADTSAPAAESSEQGEIEEAATQPQVLPEEPVFKLRQYFTFSDDLDLRVDSFACRSVLKVAGGGRSLDVIRANWRKYRDESSSLDDLLALDRAILYDYIADFDRHLVSKQVKKPADDIISHLDSYQECELRLTAKNTGFARSLNDGCGLSFGRDVSLIDDRDEIISPHHFRSIICTKAIMAFPTGATDPDVQYFVLESGREIKSIVVDNSDRGGVEAVIPASNLSFLPGSFSSNRAAG